MTLAELIDALRKILDTVELADDLRERLKRLLRALEAGEPTDIVVARLLADLLELGADKLPGPIAEFVKAYAEAFRTAIDEILGTLGRKYRRAREAGLTHEEANAITTVDPKICEFLRLRWLLDGIEPAETPPPAPPAPPQPGADTGPKTPGDLAPPPAPPLWAPEDDDCCGKLTPAERIPSVTLVAGRIYRDGGSWYFDADVEVTHKCGLKSRPSVRIYVQVGGKDVALDSHTLRGPRPEFRDASGGPGERIIFRRFQVPARPPRARIQIRAISKCMGVFDGSILIERNG